MTNKEKLMAIGDEIYKMVAGKIWNPADEMQITFTFDVEGVKDVEGFILSMEEIDFDEEDE